MSTLSKALGRAYSLGQKYWSQADSESYAENKRADATESQFNTLVAETLAAFQTAEARYEYIRARYLSDDVEAPFLPDGATYANTPEEFDAAIDSAIAALPA